MKRTLYGLLAVLFLASCVSVADTVETSHGNSLLNREVKAYIPTWAHWTADDIDGTQLTELILSFALVDYVDDAHGEYQAPLWNDQGVQTGSKSVSYTGIISDRDTRPEIYEELGILKDRYPELKITVALGGWGADGFSDAVLTEDSRQIFVESIVNYLLEHNFDGLDIDWEFPVIGGWGAIKGRPEDRENFTAFVKLLRKHMDTAEAEINRPLSLSVAANPGVAYYEDWVDVKAIVPFVDDIHIMTYDNVGMWAGKAQHHTNAAFAEDAVKRFLKAGVPAEKMVLGGAFYGKLITSVDGLNKAFSEESSVTDISWDSIVSGYLNKNGFQRHWDKTGKSAYLYNPETKELITYDDPESLKEKAAIVEKYNLAGAMFWEYSHDSSGTLVTALSDCFK